MKRIYLQIFISLISTIFIFVHLIYPNLKIDGITIFFVALGIIPWLSPLFKTIKLPGGFKIEFQDLKSIEIQANQAGLLAPPIVSPKKRQYSFLSIAQDDPNLALAGLRIEIEKRLREIAIQHKLDANYMGIGQILRLLEKESILNNNEKNIISDMISILNNAAHGAEVDMSSAQWAIDVGPRLLDGLEKAI